MIEYRKHKSGRQFARIEGDKIVKVLNMLAMTEVVVMDSSMMSQYILEDKEFYFPCTEQEFNTAYQEALQRIKEMKI